MTQRSLSIPLLAALALCAGLAEVATAQQYAFLPVSGGPKSVQRIFQDSRGRLWLMAEELVCYDGDRFFYLRDYGFPPVRTYDVAEDERGGIWIAAESGIYRFFRGRVEQVTKGVATSLISLGQSTIAATSAAFGPVPETTSLVRIRQQGGSWKVETVMPLESPGPITMDPGRMLLYPWPSKGWNEMRAEDVLRWRPGENIPVVHHNVPKAPGNGGLKVLRDHSGCVWFGAPRGNAYDCGQGWQAAPFPNANVSAAINEAPDGQMVLSGNTIVAVGRPGAFQVATRSNGLPGLQDAIQGRDGTVWLATTTGLYRFPYPFRSEYWTMREGVSDPPWSIARVGDRIYAGLDRRIVALTLDRQRWDTVAQFPKSGLVSGLLGARDGSLYAAFVDDGAAQLRPNGSLATALPGHPGCCYMRLAETEDGEVWAGGSTLARIDRKGNVLVLEDHPLAQKPSRNVLAVKYEPSTRKLWSCYNGGLVMRDANGWREISAADGLSAGGCWSLAPLSNGDVWYAHYGVRALSRLHFEAGGKPQIRQFTDNIPEPGNASLDLDTEGRLWRAADLGIYVATPAQAEAAQWLRLDQADGFPANGMNSGSVFADADGSLWWGADNDLAHFRPPADLVNPATVPQVFVSALSWEGSTSRMADAVESIPHGREAVAHIASLHFAGRNGLRLRYRILPESAWRESVKLDLPLSRLSPGNHTLELQARIFTGAWSPVTVWRFAVLWPLWWTWPFVAAYTAALLVLGAGGLRYYHHRREDQAQMLPDLAGWRIGAFAPEIQDLEGAVLDGRFEAGALIARGGFASVLLGFDLVERQRCAIKVFRREIASAEWVARTFRQEVAALEKIRHPNVVSIYSHGVQPSGSPYLVMEYIEGRSLRDVLGAGPLPPARTAVILRQIADALQAIHSQHICHRDVKPENILIRHDGTSAEQAVLIDFSIAIVKDADETLHGISRAAGTFDYMGPEQAIGYAQPSSDIYSLAKTLIEMLTGQRLRQLLPEASLDLPERVRELLHRLPVRLSPEAIAMLASALEFDPSRRPASVNEFAEPILRDFEAHSGLANPSGS